MRDRLDAEAGHLARVGAWGGVSLVAGSAAILLNHSADARAFGLQTALWGTINLTVAVAGLAGQPEVPPPGLAGALAAESRVGNLLLLNLGLNGGYVMVGTTLIAAAQGEHADVWRGHGAAIVVQGLVLLTLDGIAYAGSRQRQAALTATIALVPTPGGARLIVRL